MTSIKILPIFNQSAPGVWDDFMRIQSCAMRHVYNLRMDASDIDSCIRELRYKWARNGFNFAFGAYDDDMMVGYISGDCADNTATVNSLYVMPEYMGQHIGGRLLRLAEHSGAFGAMDMELVSLARAQTFYERFDYRPILAGSNHYIKPITPDMRARCKTMPVFKSTRSITRACSDIAVKNGAKYDALNVNNRHTPTYVYMDVNANIRAFGAETDTPVPDIYVAPHQPREYISRVINREFDALRHLHELMTNKQNQR